MSAPSPDPPILNADELLARLGGSRDVLAQLLPILTQSLPTWQAELDAAVAANDADRLRRAAHQVKGAMLTFAAPRAAAAALALEDLARAGDLPNAPAALATLMNEVTQVEAEVRKLAGS